MRIAMLGTRGVPARYGGFETAVEEVGSRLAMLGHDIVVYRRADDDTSRYRGMELVTLPALHRRSLETLSHTALSAVHCIRGPRPDVAFVFNSANSFTLPLLQKAGIPVALHLDGLEWKRGKWGVMGRGYYRLAERFGLRRANVIISDAQAIHDYYRLRYDVISHTIAYGAPLIDNNSERLTCLGLCPLSYLLIVARFEPENHVLEALTGALASRFAGRIVVVGSNPYDTKYTKEVGRLAASDPRVLMMGAVWDQTLLDALYANARMYLHGHSVGGTNPSLLRAMGASTATLAYDVIFNREVLGSAGAWWETTSDLREAINRLDDSQTEKMGILARERARTFYNWDSVAQQYLSLALSMQATDQSRRSAGVAGAQ